MKKKTIAIIVELIPVVSAVVSCLLIFSEFDAASIRQLIQVIMLLAFFGFVFSIVGRRLAKGDRAVRILGVLDWLATLYVFVLYLLVFLSLG